MNFNPSLIRLARSHAGRAVLAVIFGLTAGLLAIWQARLLSAVLAGVFTGSGRGDGIALLSLAGVGFVRAAAGFLGDWNASGLAGAVKQDLRGRLLRKFERLGPVGLSDKQTGDLAGVALQGVDSLEAYFNQFLPQAALAFFIPLGILVFVFPLDALSGLILLVTGPLIPLFMFLIGSNAEKLTGRQFEALRRMSAELLDTIQGLKTLKALGASSGREARIAQVSAAYRDTTLAVLRVTFLSALALELLGTISTALIAVQVGLRLLYGQMQFEQAFFLLVIAPDFYLPLRTLGLRFHASMQGVLAARKIFEVLHLPDLVPAEPAAAESLNADWDRIVFERVRYCYPGRKKAALDGLNLEIERGKITALVGESGAGKSTVAAILLRFLEIQEGEVRVGAQRLDRVRLEEWRRGLAWVPQKPHLFHGTIADNLRIAKEPASVEEMWTALEAAHLGDLVRRLPGGLETALGEHGARLSSGEAQRLALARAFLRNAPLLVLDEPTAHLDPEEESLMEESIRRLCAGRTVVAIAHRLETVFQADCIVVIDEGKAVEIGTHSRLAANGGAYARLLAGYGGAG